MKLNSDKKSSINFILFYNDLLVKILLGLAAATVTLMGFAFDKRISVYLLISSGVMLVGCVIFRLLKKWIVYFFIDAMKDEDNKETIENFMFVFLRNKKNIICTINSLSKINNLKKTKELNKFANGSIIPIYIGTYPALFWTTILQLALFSVSLFLEGWSLY